MLFIVGTHDEIFPPALIAEAAERVVQAQRDVRELLALHELELRLRGQPHVTERREVRAVIERLPKQRHAVRIAQRRGHRVIEHLRIDVEVGVPNLLGD